MSKRESDFVDLLRSFFGPDATAVGMPDPNSLRLRQKLDSLKTAHGDAINAGIEDAKASGMTPSPLFFLGEAAAGDPDARTAIRTESEMPVVADSLADASKRQSKFGAPTATARAQLAAALKRLRQK